MQSLDLVRIARALFEAYQRGDEGALLALARDDLRFGPAVDGGAEAAVWGHDGLRRFLADQRAGRALVQATPHRFEVVGSDQVLVSGRLRVLERGLRDSPAWWLLTFRDGLLASGRMFAGEAEARASLPLAAA